MFRGLGMKPELCPAPVLMQFVAGLLGRVGSLEFGVWSSGFRVRGPAVLVLVRRLQFGVHRQMALTINLTPNLNPFRALSALCLCGESLSLCGLYLHARLSAKLA